MKNVFKVKAIRNIAGIIAIVMAVLALNALLITGCSNGGGDLPYIPPSYIPPEDKPDKDRWNIFRDPSSTATLERSSIAEHDDGSCTVTVTVGGTPDFHNEIDGWNAWKITAEYMYTAKAGKSYTYTFQAWTESGTRDLQVLYYKNNDDVVYLSETISITNTQATYTITGDKIPKSSVQNLFFELADQLGTVYIKIIKIK